MKVSRYIRRAAGLCFVSVLGLISACGGGGGAGQAAPAAKPEVSISYSIANSTSTKVSGLQFSAYLPAGVDVPLEQGTHIVPATNLVAGSALNGLQVKAFATYSAPIRKLKCVVMPSDKASLQTGFTKGSVLVLNCNKVAGAQLSVSDFSAANGGSPVSSLVAYKYSGSQKLENVTGSLTPSVSATLN